MSWEKSELMFCRVSLFVLSDSIRVEDESSNFLGVRAVQMFCSSSPHLATSDPV